MKHSINSLKLKEFNKEKQIIFDEIVRKLQDRSPKKLSEETGLSMVEICRIKKGHVKNPRIETLQKLSEYFEKNA